MNTSILPESMVSNVRGELWVEVLRSYKEVPARFRAAFSEADKTFPYTVWVPAERTALLHKQHEKLICLYDDRVSILEAQADQINTVFYPLQDILSLSQGQILLNSWLTISSRAGSTTVSFNTINLYEFEPLLARLRQGIARLADKRRQTPQGPFMSQQLDELGAQNYKFRHYARQSIRPGETVLQAIYQPGKWVKTVTRADTSLFTHYATGVLARLKTLPFFTKPLVSLYASEHLCILTDQELILIKESKPIKKEREHLYGGVTTYIPLRQIQDLTFAADAKKSRYLMKITLPEQIPLYVEFDVDNADVDIFQKQYAALKRNP